MHSYIGPLSILIALPLLGLGMLWAEYLIYRRRPGPSIDPFQVVLKTIGWTMLVVGICAPMFASLIGISVFVVGVAITFMAIVQYRANQRRALMWMLAISAQRGLPLADAARAFAADGSDAACRSAMRLANRLDAGSPLPDALVQSRNRLPIDAEVTTRLEHETGGLGAAMIDVSRDAAERQRMWRPLFEKALYFLLLTVVAMVVMSFMMLKIVPAFEQIFADFDVELPTMTQTVVTASHWFGNWFWLFLPLLLAGLLVLVFATFYYIGWLRWEPAPLRFFTRPFHRATVLLALARVTDAERPLTKSLQLMAQWYPQPAIRARLASAQQQVELGRHWCDALGAARLLRRSDAAVLHAAERVGNLPWAMREMALRNYRRVEVLAGVLNNVILPLLLLLYAMPIAFIVVAMFLPLVSLIQNLA